MMLSRSSLGLMSIFALITLGATSVAAQELSRNGNCEQIENGKPVGWGAYDGVAEWGCLEQGYRGKAAYFVPKPFAPISSGERKGEDYQSAALVLGSRDGYSGADAFVTEPPAGSKYYRYPVLRNQYTVSFWIKSEASRVRAHIQTWRSEQAPSSDRIGGPLIATVPKTDEWTHYQGTVALPHEAKRYAVMFQVDGYQRDGLELGRVCVDEVSITKATAKSMTPDDLPRIEIPEQPALLVGNTPLEQVLADYRAGDQAAISQVKGTISAAQKLAEKPDEWYRQFYKSFEPRGVYTVTCPLHPFKTRYYNDFSWSIEEPWRLVCKHCQAEGRKYYYYPNPDYPDDGNGCAPTDEVWARTHDEAWSQAHDNIPHAHWDGNTHGDSGGGRRYYFLGKYYVNAILHLQGTPVQTLALAWHYATKLFPVDSEEHKLAATYAHKAKVIMLCTARAYLGDDYLAAAEGFTPEQFQKRMEGFYQSSQGDTWRYEKLAGFRPFNWTDTTVGDPLYEDRVKAQPFGYYGPFIGAWNWRAGQARTLLEANCMLWEAFTEEEADLRRICQRSAVSVPGDRERVARSQDPVAFYLKRGCVEMELQPYSMVAAGDNLASSTLTPVVRMGLMLRDDKILDNVARDVYYFYRNHLSQDGLGAEGSPTYTPSLTGIMQILHGLKGDFDRSAPYYDEAEGINLFKMPVYKDAVSKMLYYATEDDYYIAWEDSVYDRGRRSTTQLGYMANYGGGIPEKHRQYLNISRQDDGTMTVGFNRAAKLPPVLLHDRRKAILRAGPAEAPTVVSLNFTKACGHLHDAVQDLIIHACRQELASDLGYLGSDHFLRPWLKSHPAHNCLVLRAADGNPSGTTRIRGDLRKHFLIAPNCQVADSAEYDAADWAAFDNGASGEMSRQVLLMTPSEDHQYVIDIARGRGGDTHDYYFHCHGLGFDTDGLALTQVEDPEQSLYDYSGWSFRADKYFGARCITDLATAVAQGSWQATWSRIDDYRGQPAGQPLIHDDVFLRLWMADAPRRSGFQPDSTKVIIGDGPAQRHFKNEDIGRRMKIVCVRRPNTARVDNFVAVMEPYQNIPFIKNVRRLEPGVDDEYTVALAVETIYGTDYVISYGGPDRPSPVTVHDGEHTISTDADLAVVSYPAVGPVSLLLAGGGHLNADGFELAAKGPPEFTGRLLDFSDLDDTLTIAADTPFPVGEVMAGQPIIVQHAEDRSTFAIKSVAALGDNQYLVHLDDQPHLMDNWLLVRSVSEDGIVVEPTPVLDSKRRTFKVYGGEPGKMRLLGPLRGTGATTIRNEFGTSMHSIRTVVTDDYSGIEPGQEIAITRLEKGRDTVSVTNFAYASADG